MSTATLSLTYPAREVVPRTSDGGSSGKGRSLARYAPVVLILGTGVVTGLQHPPTAITSGTAVYSPFADVRQTPDLAQSNVVPDINEIKSSLRLTVTDIARALGKSRQAVYKWLAGEARPEPATEMKIRLLATVGRDFASAEIQRPDLLVKMGVVGKRSILDLLSTDELTTTHIEAAIAEAKASSASHERIAVDRSAGEAGSDWMATMSLPGGRE